ncbi:flagellar biosynthetic protein FliR [Neokomagataea thailandica NBRC 106555]|uniref:Type III secretion protein n=2 Tax=Neokomagataea TaxID=1223423 RepID=A0A4Y6V8T4_9PROT|nr:MULTISPECIES: flagellar biosynthetic protein FliR [Neokomagataea]QDH25080.1 type III secretion protein [Neokomagataea tanensis]GBR54166.1 flagellar biosynthetic protein FliR [Neokomagataea thailandica NBRC 106555]
MTSALPLTPDALAGTCTIFLLVLCRVSAAILVLPGLGEQSLPMTLRAGIALTTTLLIAPIVAPHLTTTSPDTTSAIALAAMIAVELFAGITIGWMARLIVLALPIAGQMIALFIGLSSVLQPDPDLGSGSSAPARFFNILAPLLLLISGAYILPIRALTGSYTIIPLGGVALQPQHFSLIADTTQSIITLTERGFTLALELSAPFLILSLVWQALMGIISRLLPSLQISTVLSPLQILGGLALLGLTLETVLVFWQNQTFDVLNALPGL